MHNFKIKSEETSHSIAKNALQKEVASDIMSDDALRVILKKFTPLQLANVSSVSSQFLRVTKERLSIIQNAFFSQKDFILKNKLKDNFNDILMHLKDLYPYRYAVTDKLKENYNMIKLLVNDGALINSTGLEFIQEVVFHYTQCVRSIIQWNTCNLNANLDLASFLKKVILFLIENNININEPSTSEIYCELKNLTVLEYAQKNASYIPEVAAILTDYNNAKLDLDDDVELKKLSTKV